MFMRRLKRVLLFFALAYVGLFVLCFVYEYTQYSPQVHRSSTRFESLAPGAAGKKNYASAQYTYAGPSAAAATQVDQKYERTATVQTRSKDFDADEKKVRETIREFTGIVQYENGRGIKGQRMLYLHVGVQPAVFNAFYGRLQAIGDVASMEISKTDKTNEFLALKAKRLSLEKNRASLLELKKREGRIEEFMGLEREIQKIDQELQSLGVSLGDFDEVNAFCTARISLAEYRESVRVRGLLSYCKEAFFLSLAWYAGGLGMLLLLLTVSLVLLVVVDKFNIVRKIVDASSPE